MSTPLDLLVEAVRATAAFNPTAEAAPEAVLWCDAGRDFLPLLPGLRARMPNLLTLGSFQPEARTGPALWLRAAAARRVQAVEWAAGEPPVLYLPGHGREALKGAEDCPEEIAPLVWFAVAGAFFGHGRQGRDWTLRGFLAAQGSPVGFRVPEDAGTRAALARAATRLFAEPLAASREKRWDAAALDGLLADDPVADMLAWIDGGLTAEADPARFEAFAALAARRFHFDLRKKNRQDAAARLARKEREWAKVWDRFAEAGVGYDEVVRLLGREKPEADLLAIPDAYPAENARREDALRAALLSLKGAAQPEAAKAVAALEAEHAWRRTTVWSRRGEAKLALALEHLALVAAAKALPPNDARAMAAAYAEEGWRVDAAALVALDHARAGEDRDAVVATLRAVYLPWLGANADALQSLAARGRVDFARPGPAAPPAPDAAVLFVDALRMDVARRLADRLRASGAAVEVGWRWAGFPTVTATCKALASPAAGLLTAGSADAMLPSFSGRDATKPVLEKAIEAAGWSCSGGLLGGAAMWSEVGRFDQEGHALGARLAERIEGGVEEVAGVALRLAKAGRRVRIVTDHGWLLAPGGLPHADLAAGLVAPSSGKANRVAMLKEGAPSGYPRLPWSWDGAVSFTTPPGARAFYKGTEYAHGGVSPQECVLPVLDVSAGAAATSVAVTARWRGLLAKVRVEGGAGLMADIRLGRDGDGPSALIKAPKTLDDAGEANLGIDDAHAGKDLCAVVYRADAPDDILAKAPTRAEG